MPRALPIFGVLAGLITAALVGCVNDPAQPPVPSAELSAPVASGKPQNAYVLLSGGGSPLDNNYSQYLQARAIAEFFVRETSHAPSWVFFGVGNREGHPPILADVRHDKPHNGRLVSSWLPGVLPENRPATRENFLRALRQEILPTVRSGGTLFLFVGDHGELAGKGETRESAITLWGLKHDHDGEWNDDAKELLRVSDLRQALTDGLGAGRVVFCMTQCHSGGFHDLGVAREMTAPRHWFSTVPNWAGANATGVRLKVAGFTATDQASLAAGCDAAPDPQLWRGYERFLPEQLLGIDLMTGRRNGAGAASFAAAHEPATLVDDTIDKPRATSEHYLERWAHLIETRLMQASLTPAAERAVVSFQRAVDGKPSNLPDPRARQRAAQFHGFVRELAEELPDSKELLVSGSRQALESVTRARGERGSGRGGRRGAMTDVRRAWTDTLRPAWKQAVKADRVPGLSGAAREFEQHLLALEDDGNDLLLGRNKDTLLNEVYWNSGYAKPATMESAKAEAVARWGAERRAQIVTWAGRALEPRIRAAAHTLGPGPRTLDETARPLSARTAVERVLFYRRVLAAWEFLLRLDAQPALTELGMLIELEETPLRNPPLSHR